MGFQVRRSFQLIDPLLGERFTGPWQPEIGQQRIINPVKPALDGSAAVAVYALTVSTDLAPVIFTSDLAANTFGAAINITNSDFTVERSRAVIMSSRSTSTLHPAKRIGYLDSPDLNTEIQQFTY